MTKQQKRCLREIAFYLEGRKHASGVYPLGQIHLDALWEVSKKPYTEEND